MELLHVILIVPQTRVNNRTWTNPGLIGEILVVWRLKQGNLFFFQVISVALLYSLHFIAEVCTGRKVQIYELIALISNFVCVISMLLGPILLL